MKLSNGYKIASPGAILTLISIFLPWMTTTCGNLPPERQAGWQVAFRFQENADGVFQFAGNVPILLAFLFAILVLYFAYAAAQRGTLLTRDRWPLIVVAVLVLLLLFLQYGRPNEDIEREFHIGFWLFSVGYLLIGVGGLLNQTE